MLQAAHAAELLIKARIAQEHPLLIFEHLPRSTQTAAARLDLEDLFRQGRTLQWADLPERLWAATGIKIPNKDAFDAFGKLRNGVQHFAPAPGCDAAEETLRFVFGVIDPFIHEAWGLFAIDWDEDDDPYVYLVGPIVHREIEFLVSPDAASRFDDWAVDWSTVSSRYRSEMHRRVEAARSAG